MDQPIRTVPGLGDALGDYLEAWTAAGERSGASLDATSDPALTAPDGEAPSASSALAPLIEIATDQDLHAVLAAAGKVRRQLDAAIAAVAAEITSRTDRQEPSERLLRGLGFRSCTELVAHEIAIPMNEAKRYKEVGVAVAPRRSLLGETLPADAEHVAAAVEAGRVGMAAAEEIVQFRRRMRGRVEFNEIAEGERVLVDMAPELSLRDLRRAIAHLEAHLDQDGLEPKIERQVQLRSLRFRTDADGLVHLTGRLDPITAAPIKHAIDNLVTHHLRASRDESQRPGDGPVFRPVIPEPARHTDGERGAGTEARNGNEEPAGADVRENEALGISVDSDGKPLPVSSEERSIDQLAADALAMICAHATGCRSDELPNPSTTVIVRMPLSDLAPAFGRSADAAATSDDDAESYEAREIESMGPIDAHHARKMAASADLIPMVLGTDGEVLDLGRRARHFNRAQRLALIERDGGCAFCGLPPSMTEAHHIRWWTRHGGSTDLANGILLCTTCHHRIHEGWDVDVVPGPGGGTVWFRPPALIDRRRRPRIGGRKRFDPVFRRHHPPTFLTEPTWSAHTGAPPGAVPMGVASEATRPSASRNAPPPSAPSEVVTPRQVRLATSVSGEPPRGSATTPMRQLKPPSTLDADGNPKERQAGDAPGPTLEREKWGSWGPSPSPAPRCDRTRGVPRERHTPDPDSPWVRRA